MRTSVEMIEKYNASYIKTTLDVAAIDVRKGTPRSQRHSQGYLEAHGTTHYCCS